MLSQQYLNFSSSILAQKIKEVSVSGHKIFGKEAKGSTSYTAVTTGSGKTFMVDGSPKSLAASPLEYVLGAYIACISVTSNFVSTAMGIPLKELTFKSVKGTIELDAFEAKKDKEGKRIDSKFYTLDAEIEVVPTKEGVTQEDIEKFGHEVALRCPVAGLFLYSDCKINEKWVLKKE